MKVPRGKKLTHVDRSGRSRMVDVSRKPTTERVAIARAAIRMHRETLALIEANQIAKGDVLTLAQIAGVMAAKRTADLIPLCHPLPLTDIQVRITTDRAAGGVVVETEAKTVAQTGVEMEALVAAAVAALTVYDMCKAHDRDMTIERVRLVHKRGGRSGSYTRSGENP